MFGTSAQALTSFVLAPFLLFVIPTLDRTANTAYAAAATAALLLGLGVIITFWLPAAIGVFATHHLRSRAAL